MFIIELNSYISVISLIILFAVSVISLINRYNFFINALMIAYLLLWILFITVLWIELERAPHKTLGETRIWYSFLVPIISWFLYLRNSWRWIIPYGALIAGVFILINLLHPENFSNELIPALQSIWFVPHVLVYMFAYAFLGVATAIAFHSLFFLKDKISENFFRTVNNLLYTGFAFLTVGLLFGAIWAKEAWGNYWTWDPKEVWALTTWFMYLTYIHYMIVSPKKHKIQAYLLIIAFIFLLICWFGVNYLPISKFSLHTY